MKLLIYIYLNQNNTEFNIDLVMLVAILFTSTVGSIVQITHKNFKLGIEKKEKYAIYTSGLMIAVLAYFLGTWQNNLFLACFTSVFGAYMSLDLFDGARKAIIGILGIAPKLAEIWARNKFEIKDESNNNNDNHEEL